MTGVNQNQDQNRKGQTMKYRHALDTERIRQKITTTELAKAAGISRTSLSQIINGATLRPHARTMYALANALHATTATLFPDEVAE